MDTVINSLITESIGAIFTILVAVIFGLYKMSRKIDILINESAHKKEEMAYVKDAMKRNKESFQKSIDSAKAENDSLKASITRLEESVAGIETHMLYIRGILEKGK